MTAAGRKLVVVDTSPGGGGAITSIAHLARCLAERDISTAVIAGCPEAFGALAPELEVHALGRDDFGATRGIAYGMRELVRAQRIARHCERLGADVVLANNAPPANLGAHLAARQLGLEIAQYVRGPFHASSLSRSALLGSSAVFAVGHAAARTLEQLLVAFTPVAEGLHADRWPSPRRPDANRWLWCSGLARWKGLPLALRAYAHASTEITVPTLEVCYAPLAHEHEECDRIPTEVPTAVRMSALPADLDAIRADCSVYVHTALRPEPFGRSILEAMAAGLCPVVPDHIESAELVIDGENGLTYSSGDAEDLARVLVLLARRPELARELGANAARTALEYQAEEVFCPVVDELDAMLARSATRTHFTAPQTRIGLEELTCRFAT